MDEHRASRGTLGGRLLRQGQAVASPSNASSMNNVGTWSNADVGQDARRRRLLGGEPDRQRLQLVEEECLGGDGPASERDCGVALERLLDHDLQREASQCGSQTEVPSARAEGLVLGVAGNVKTVGVLIACLIAV